MPLEIPLAAHDTTHHPPARGGAGPLPSRGRVAHVGNGAGVVHVISLGAGVQSSTMALMAAHGEIGPMPKCAIFADTKAEPQSVYRWLDWLEKRLPFPVRRVIQGAGLVDDTLRLRRRKDNTGYWSPSGVPHYNRNNDGTTGHGPRQCTKNFKIAPIARETRRIMKESGAQHIVRWIGISLDEVHRMKPSRDKYSTHIWPLIDKRMTRHDCKLWMDRHGYPPAPRSACVFCPYHSDSEWRRLKIEEPEEFELAVKFERDYQQTRSQQTRSQQTRLRVVVPFLHKSCVPLSQVDFSTDEDHGQQVMFGNECEGMCGV